MAALGRDCEAGGGWAGRHEVTSGAASGVEAKRRGSSDPPSEPSAILQGASRAAPRSKRCASHSPSPWCWARVTPLGAWPPDPFSCTRRGERRPAGSAQRRGVGRPYERTTITDSAFPRPGSPWERPIQTDAIAHRVFHPHGPDVGIAKRGPLPKDPDLLAQLTISGPVLPGASSWPGLCRSLT